MIVTLSQLLELVEDSLDQQELDLASFARAQGSTEYHLRRMFSSLFGMPLAEYLRRRRMTVAVADVLGERRLLDIAVQYGYSSTEAFGRAFRAVHGSSVAEVREHGGPLRSQPKLRLRITIEGNTPMDARITDLPATRLVGYAARVPLIYQGANPHIQAHIAALPPEVHGQLKALANAQPEGLLAITADVDPDYVEGSQLSYLHGVSVSPETAIPTELDVIELAAGKWAVFKTSGQYPAALQETWAATATDWFPANPWRLRPGPSMVSVLERSEDFSTATTELWLPIEES
ncbi:AraC family transcriptional regulator [Psychromicrobium lacuslunae]|uniref:AraC family transcriptional regulator n=1 Tax=Psychromicrobium lacuslunae TaxID=1618207 RepID=A0A0D4BY93_9MICC|nr:AraC family transcriptional regulator [Psychromicrobium lacuslunae]AJT41085.1 AraC family transcriptional regulator [Psychromicrobium lacuslunae]